MIQHSFKICGNNFPSDFTVSYGKLTFHVLKRGCGPKETYDVYENGDWYAFISLVYRKDGIYFECNIEKENTIIKVGVNHNSVTDTYEFINNFSCYDYFHDIFAKIIERIDNIENNNTSENNKENINTNSDIHQSFKNIFERYIPEYYDMRGENFKVDVNGMKFDVIVNDSYNEGFNLYMNGIYYATIMLQCYRYKDSVVNSSPKLICDISEKHTNVYVNVPTDAIRNDSFVDANTRKKYLNRLFNKLYHFIQDDTEKHCKEKSNNTVSEHINQKTDIAKIAIDHPEYLSNEAIREMAAYILNMGKL